MNRHYENFYSIHTILFCANLALARCKVGFVDEDSRNRRTPFSALKNKLKEKNIELVLFSNKGEALEDSSTVFLLSTDEDVNGDYSKSVSRVSLTFENRLDQKIKTFPMVAKIVERSIKQRQAHYQIQSGDSKPIGYYFEQLRFSLSPKPRKVLVLDSKIAEISDTIEESCAQNL